MAKEQVSDKTDTITAPHVYQAIAAITATMSKDGISKSRNNAQQGYKFRGIDDVYNALAPMLAEHNLCILPEMLNRTVNERQTQKGATLFYVTVEANFDFVSAKDGSKHKVKTFGEAMDSADKATNKAMSAAYKYACIQAFCIPTEGDNDADAATHEIAPQAKQAFRTNEERMDWLHKAGIEVKNLRSPEDVKTWEGQNEDKIQALGEKQKDWLEGLIAQKRINTQQAPLNGGTHAHA